MPADVVDADFVDEADRLREPDCAGIVRRAAGLPAPRSRTYSKSPTGEIDGVSKYVSQPPSGSATDRYPASGALTLARNSLLRYRKPQPNGAISHLCPPQAIASTGVLLHVEWDGADLLHGVDDQEDATLAAEPRQRVEIAAKAVAPLHGADGDDAGLAGDRGFDVLDQKLSVTIGKDIDLDADSPRASAARARRLPGIPGRR